MDLTYVYFLIGCIVVFVFASNFFNKPGYSFVDEDHATPGNTNDEMLEPALPSYLTERFEYNFFRATFILVAESLYILLVLFLPDFNSATAAVDASITGSASAADPAAAPVNVREKIILATLIITGMAPNLPWIKDLLEKSKLYLHKKAQIPYKGRAIYRRIKNGKPCYKKAMIEKLLIDQRFLSEASQVSRLDLTAEDFELGAWTLEARWAKLSYLLYYVEIWTLQYPFKSYIQNPELHYSSIDTHYQQLFKLMMKYKAGDISGEEKLRLETGLDITLNRSYRLISCLLYLSGKSDSMVDTYLDQLGYLASEHNEFPIPWNTLALIIYAVFGSILIGSIAAFFMLKVTGTSLPQNLGFSEIASWIGYGTPFIVLPMLLVLMVKRYLSTHGDTWPTVPEQGLYNSTGDRPWFIYFIVALSSYILGALVLLTILFTKNQIKGEEINLIPGIRSVLAWSSIVFLTAFYTAFRLDSGSRPDNSRIKFYLTRTAGALSQGLATSGLIYLVYLYAHDKTLNIIFEPIQGQTIDSKIYVLCIIGFLLGVSVNIAIGFGRLRQRRKYGRRIARRTLKLKIADQEVSEAETLNISPEGALINIQDTEILRDEQALRDTPVYLSSQDGHKWAKAKVMGKRGSRLHLFFENIENWSRLRESLNLPAQA
jgi:hypothetical protein